MSKNFDVIIIGAGPAGIMCAIQAADKYKNILVIDRLQKPLTRLLASGGGRCNLSNTLTKEEFFKGVTKNNKFIHSTWANFNNNAVTNYFESRGVKLKVENGKYIFPEDDQSYVFYDAFMQEIIDKKVNLQLSTTVNSIDKIGDNFMLETSAGSFTTTKLVMACGGQSYPNMGVTSLANDVCDKFGISFNSNYQPINVPLKTFKFRDISGVSLKNIILSDGKNEVKADILFTHFGISGPAPIRLSCHLKGDETIYLKSIFESNKEEMFKKYRAIFNSSQKNVINALGLFFLPNSFIKFILHDFEGKMAKQVSNEELKIIIERLTNYPIKLDGKMPLNIAFSTDGGVDVKEVEPSTMQSKKVSGLYFIGEVLDINAYTGGYNITLWISTGYTCGKSV